MYHTQLGADTEYSNGFMASRQAFALSFANVHTTTRSSFPVIGNPSRNAKGAARLGCCAFLSGIGTAVAKLNWSQCEQAHALSAEHGATSDRYIQATRLHTKAARETVYCVDLI